MSQPHTKIENCYKSEGDHPSKSYAHSKLVNHLSNEYTEQFGVKSVAEPVTAAIRGQLRAIRRKKDQLKKALKRPHRIVRKYLSRRKHSQEEQEDEESEEVESEVEQQQPSSHQLSEKPIAQPLFPDEQPPPSQESIKKDKYMEESNIIIDAKPILINLYHPVQQGIRANFRITRNNSALKYFTPQFALYPQNSDNALLYARKISPLVFSLSLEQGKWHPSSPHWVGRLISNLTGSELSLYLRLPNRADEQLACTIEYSNSYLQFTQPRRIALYLPAQPLPSTSPSLAQLWKKPHREGLRQLKSRQPRWDKSAHCYRLDFSGRAIVSSVKNFILEQPSHPGRDQLVLAKQSGSCFSLGVMWPVSGVVGFAVGLSGFNGKVICE